MIRRYRLKLKKYSMGIGDRFGKQGMAQLTALLKAKESGADITPIWNKSFREHQIIGTTPDAVRKEADQSIKSLGWSGAYYVDADHVNLKTVNDFISSSDFFTLDVADAIGENANPDCIQQFVNNYNYLIGTLSIQGLTEPVTINADFIYHTADKYLFAVQEAGRIYQYIKDNKKGDFITEVSMDETDSPQSPQELLLILAMIKEEGIPAQTVAPKFSGRFNKGVDYVGDPTQFTQEFEADLAIIQYAVQNFELSDNLKLSVHSGSDKFMLYPIIKSAIQKFDAGIHLKTAGTTWLEELIGLAEAQNEGLEIAKKIYGLAYQRFDALCQPYATVIDINFNMLPKPEVVQKWNGSQYAHALRHNQNHPDYNMHFRQLLHVGYKIAAEMGTEYFNALDRYQEIVGHHVTENLFERHIKPLFL
ncbi:tagaturonate epimerase family protein [bacterium]